MTFTTLGIRASAGLSLGGTRANLNGMLGWRHAFGDTTPFSRLAFAGSDNFTIEGVPIGEDAAVIEAGLDLAVAENATFGVSYSGQIAESETEDHGVRAALAVTF